MWRCGCVEKLILFLVVTRTWIVCGDQNGLKIPGGRRLEPGGILRRGRLASGGIAEGGRLGSGGNTGDGRLRSGGIPGGGRLGSGGNPGGGRLGSWDIPERGRLRPRDSFGGGGRGPGRKISDGRLRPEDISGGGGRWPGFISGGGSLRSGHSLGNGGRWSGRIPGARRLGSVDIPEHGKLRSWDIPEVGRREPGYTLGGEKRRPVRMPESGGRGPGRISRVGRQGIPVAPPDPDQYGDSEYPVEGGKDPGSGDDAKSNEIADSGSSTSDSPTPTEQIKSTSVSPTTTGSTSGNSTKRPKYKLSTYPDGGRPGPAALLGSDADYPDDYYNDGLDPSSNEQYIDTTTVKNLGVLEIIGDAFVGAWEGMFDFFQGMMRVDYDEDILRACHVIAITYMSAVEELRKYFDIRFLYVDNVEYEIGYMIFEIISKYQKMLEIYYLVERRYFFNQTWSDNTAPPTYMLYMYTNVLELSKVIMHQCNMLNEIEAKYKGRKNKIWDDVNMTEENEDLEGAYLDDIARYEHLKKKKRIEQRRKRKKLMKLGIAGRPPRTRRPIKGPFPLNYGWSIENW